MNDRLFLITTYFGMNGEGRLARAELSALPESGDPSWNRACSGEQCGLSEGYKHEVTMTAAINGEIVEWTVPAVQFFALMDMLRKAPRREARLALSPSLQPQNCTHEEHEAAVDDLLRNNGLPTS